MSVKDLIPRIGRKKEVEQRKQVPGVLSFQRDMNRLFDDFFESFDTFGTDDFALAPFGDRTGHLAAFSPRINVSETDTELKISAELPGLDEKDVSVELGEDVLTIRGEKKMEHEEKNKRWHRVEHSYGMFHRVVPLPDNVDGNKAKAKFNKGVLSVTIPKVEGETSKRKVIEIESE